jgi:hypothetical protein
MKESTGLYMKRVSGTNNPDFLPPMSSAAMQKDSADIGSPSRKKRRQISLESGPVLGVAVVEPHVGSSESSPPPTPSPASVSAATQPDTSEENNDRTSKDYYFDSYSHHAIRK